MSDHSITSLIEKLEGAEESKYLIASRKRTRRGDAYVSLWGPDRCGYKWPLPWAGLYCASEADNIGDHPDDDYADEHSYAVPLSAVASLMVMPRVGEIDGDAGPALPNKPKVWKIIKAQAALLRAQSEARV